jgi:hypothetical protein
MKYTLKESRDSLGIVLEETSISHAIDHRGLEFPLRHCWSPFGQC